MKRRILTIITLIALLVCVYPTKARAMGGVVVIKGDNLYHDLLCSCVTGSYLEDLIWFDTTAKAERAGYSPCEECDASSVSDFAIDGDIHFFSEDNKITCALEVERFVAILEGFSTGKEYGYEEAYDSAYDLGYDDGYDEGYNLGKTAGEEDGYSTGYGEGKESVETNELQFWILVAIFAAVAFYCGRQTKQINLDDELKNTRIENYKLHSELTHQKEILDMVELIAKDVKMTPIQFCDSLYVNYLIKCGYSEEKAQLQIQNARKERTHK